MNNRSWVKKVLYLTTLSCSAIFAVNYIVDPYELNMNQLLKLNRRNQKNYMCLTKIMQSRDYNPVSICLGTSRTEYGYNPSNDYFIQPAYNYGVEGSSMYETLRGLKDLLLNRKLKKILLCADWVGFYTSQTHPVAFESYFTTPRLLYYLDRKMFRRSRKTISRNLSNEWDTGYLCYGQDNPQRLEQDFFDTHPEGHFKNFKKSTKYYYRGRPQSSIYEGTSRNSFDDFEKIISLCYEHNIELDIIFGPSHIWQWESFDYWIGFDKWLQWKKDVFAVIQQTAQANNKKQFRLMDFSVYHPLTAEEVPKDPKVKMKYHWENSHYKDALGTIVLDRLRGAAPEYNDFGVELTAENIDSHLVQQKINRHKYIDVEAFRKEIFRQLR